MPTIIGTSSPSGIPSLTRPPTSNTTAPTMIGIDIRKLIRTAASRLKPMNRAAVIVIPDREVPGFSASAWAAPTMIASRVRMSSIGRAPLTSVRPRQQQAEHDQRDGDDQRRSEVLVDRVGEHGADHRRRHGRQHEQPRQPGFVGGGALARDELSGTRTHVRRRGRGGSIRRRRTACRCAARRRTPSPPTPIRSRPIRRATARAAGVRSTRSAGTR